MRARALLAPAFVALGVWCAAGELTTAAADSSVRLAVPAPWWVLVVGFAAAAASPAWRQSPWLAAPALVATLPWWPVPLPAVALIWTGPLAWAPVGVAAAIGPGRVVAGALARVLTALAPGRATLAAAAATALLAVATAWLVAPRLPGGDEPHYLVITQSLLRDGDLRIENNHADRDYAAYFGGEIAPDYLVRGRDGEIYSIHAPGVSALVAPAFAAFGYRGTQAVILLLAVATGALVWRVGWLATGDAAAAWFGWAAIALSATFLLQSVTIFPDGPGALAVALVCWLLVRLEPSRGAMTGGAVTAAPLAVTGAALAALPWLHTRFAVLAAGFGLAIGWRLVTDTAPDTASRARRLAAFLVVPAVSALAWFGFFWSVYGTPNPTAPYGDRPETSLAFVPGGLMGLLFDQQFGLLVAAPVLAVAAFGLTRGPGAFARRASGAIVLVYLAVVCTYWMWWAGRPATPARFSAAALPALALPLAWAWRRSSARARTVWLALLAGTAAVSTLLLTVDRGALAWNDRTADAALLQWLGPVVDLPRGLSSFFWRLDPERLSSVWPFAVHALATLSLVALATAWIARASDRRTRAVRPGLVGLAFGGLVLSMATVQMGWWLNGLPAVDPVRSQLTVLARLDPGQRLLRLAPWSLTRAPLGEAGMRLAGERPGRTETTVAWLTLTDVPPARFSAIVTRRRPAAAGRLEVRLGRAAEPWRVVDVGPGSPAEIDLDLPAGARALAFRPDEALRAAGGDVGLTAAARYPDRGHRAQSSRRYGSIEAFFTGDDVFPEPDGFWVRGGRTAGVVLWAPGRSSLEVMLQNGAAAQTVRLRVDGAWREFPLAPSERLTVDLPAEHGISSLTIASPAGFTPAEVSGGDDRRYLGVWVSPGSE
jgi:hypothetical protein